MNKQHRATLALSFAVALLCRLALGDAYDPPADYYDYAIGRTGATLKEHLRVLIDAVDDPSMINNEPVIGERVETPMSYDAARSSLQVTDAAPGQPGYMLAVYDRTPIHVAAINPGGSPPGWDSGATWNREHTWPRSRGIGSSGRDDSDLFNLRPALTANNGDRGELNFGGAFGAQGWGTVTDGGQTYWYPGDADAGVIARQEFYMAVRFNGSDSNTLDLEIGAGNVANPTGSDDPPPQLGNFNRLIEWHFAAPPDTFERNRNQIIYTNYQNNRNPFIDHPEYAWAVFVTDASGNSIPNDSQISISGATVNADGSSTKAVNLGRVFVGGAVPAAQTFTLNKAGNNGTYYSVTASTSPTSSATSTVTGRYNVFRTNQTDSKSITVGLDTTTTTAGIRTGSVTVDNLDVTLGSAGHGGSDADDTFNLSLNVLDHMTPSFASPSLQTSKTLDFGNVAIGSAAPTLNLDIFNLNGTIGSTANMDFDSFTPSGSGSAFTTNFGASAGLLQIAAGTSFMFTTSLNLTSVGTFTAMYTLNFSDENLTGAQNKTLTLTLTGKVRLAGDFNNDGSVDAGDYVVWQRSLGQPVATAYSGADGDGDLTVDSDDYDVWRAHFGQMAPGSGSGASLAGVPEPATFWLSVISTAFVCHCLRRAR